MAYRRLFYHIIWGTKRGGGIIEAKWEETLYNVIVAQTLSLGAIVYAVGGIENHVHLAVSVPPGVALSKFIGQMKGSSSHFVNHTINQPDPFAWQSEYGVVSFGEKQLDIVCHDVRNQREHHCRQTTIGFLERIET